MMITTKRSASVSRSDGEMAARASSVRSPDPRLHLEEIVRFWFVQVSFPGGSQQAHRLLWRFFRRNHHLTIRCCKSVPIQLPSSATAKGLIGAFVTNNELQSLRSTIDRLMIAWLWLHLPAVALCAWLGGNDVVAPCAVAVAVAAAATGAWAVKVHSQSTRLTIAIAFVAMVSLLLAASRGAALQIDLHMYYFAALAILAAYCEWQVILVASIVTVLDHVVLDYLAPAMIFPGGANFGRVLLHTMIVVAETGALVWMILRIQHLFNKSAHSLAVAQEALTELTAAQAREVVQNQVQFQLQRMARTDGLTGLPNRRAFDEAFTQECNRSQREAAPISLLMIDIDHFKTFNDEYGHQVGDDCLSCVAASIQNAVRRPGDMAARYGGEEFAVILATTGSAGAMAVAMEIKLNIAALSLPHASKPDSGISVTVSIGLATALWQPVAMAEMPRSLLAAADGALYNAKRNGRDQIAAVRLIDPDDPSAGYRAGASHFAVMRSAQELERPASRMSGL